jgi:hypothetical protein
VSSADDFAQWTIDIPTTGRYRVEIDYACHPDAAGHRLVIQTRNGSLRYNVDSTAGWEDYIQQTIGELDLPAGLQPIIAKPAERPLPALLDLREIRMIRVP